MLQVFANATEKVKVVNYGRYTYEMEAALAEDLQSVMQGENLGSALAKTQIKAQGIIGQREE